MIALVLIATGCRKDKPVDYAKLVIGEWEINENVLSGIYSDGQSWGSEYQVSFSGGNTMTLKAMNGSDEVMGYSREAIPSEVIDGSLTVKSASDGGCRPVL